MISPFIDFFEIKIDYDLKVLKTDQTLASLTSSILNNTYQLLNEIRLGYVAVQGDTTTEFASSLAAFYL